MSYSNIIASGSNVIGTALSKDMAKFDFGGLLITLERIVNDYKFINKIKKNPNQPDIQVYEQKEKGEDKPQVASLWINKSKAGKAYLSGQDNENKKLVGFYNQDTKDGKYPAIRVYYSNNK